MKKIIKILIKKAKLTIMVYLEYRSSILFYSLGSVFWALISIFLQQYIFREIHTLGGWTFGEFALLNGIYNFAFSFFLIFSWNSIYVDFRRAVKKWNT
ncbi:hypothetical protein ACFLY9_01520 [Patescibacteria group bacterium]